VDIDNRAPRIAGILANEVDCIAVIPGSVEGPMVIPQPPHHAIGLAVRSLRCANTMTLPPCPVWHVTGGGSSKTIATACQDQVAGLHGFASKFLLFKAYST
jgi:hypothetical protein